MPNGPEQPSLDERWLLFSADPLSQITGQVRMSSLSCGLLRGKPPFAHRVEHNSHNGVYIGLFLITRGQLYVGAIEDTDDAPMLVETGDMVVMPHGLGYRIQYPLDVSPELEVLPAYVQDSSRPQAEEIEWLVMGCHLDSAHRDLLVDFLPHAIHLRKAGLTRWLKRTLELFRAEHQASSSGRGSVLSRLAEIVLVQALRLWIEQMPDGSKGWLLALKDEQIAQVLRAIHQDPGYQWTVESLARHAAMSRTVFATRFKTLVGESPMQYVSRWRMHRAAGLLERGSTSLKSVVAASGYHSAATFRTNFKRRFGKRPSEYRRRHR